MKKDSYTLSYFVISGILTCGAGGIIASLYQYSAELLALSLVLMGALNGILLSIKTKNILGESHFLSVLSRKSTYSIINNVALVIFFIAFFTYLFYLQEAIFQPIFPVFILTYFILMISMEATRKPSNL